MQLSERHQEYWRKNLRLTAVLPAVWFVATFVVIYFAPQLNDIVIMGFPSSSGGGQPVLFFRMRWPVSDDSPQRSG